MEYGNSSQTVVVRQNGTLKNRGTEEAVVELTEGMQLSELLKIVCKKFGCKENYKIAKLYNKSGLPLFNDDIMLLGTGDILYLAIKGEEFNFSAILDDYQIIKELGQGGFGKVVLGKHKENKQEVAIKFMDVSESLSSAHSSQNIYKEAESLKKLVHKNIIQLYQAFVEGKQLVMIMECAAGGELYKWVEERGRISEVETRRIIQQVVNAMHYCHIRGIVHRDLKLENVLFKQTGDLTIKVVDFGIAGVCDATKKDKVDAGSIAYMPPESFKSNSETSPAIDVWAIGVMQYAMLFGRLPFWGDTEEETINKIQNAPLKFDPEVCITDECKEFMTNMLQKQADKRMDLINLIQLPYFIMDDEELEQKIHLAEERHALQKQEEEEKSALLTTEENLMKNFNIAALNLNPAPKGGPGAKVGKNGALGSAKNVVKGGPVGMKPSAGSIVGGSGGSGSSNGSALKKPSGAAKK